MLHSLRALRSALSRTLTLRKAATPRTRLVKAEVKRLSLCRRGKNGLSTLYKADGTLQLETLCKATDEGTLLAVVYAPERLDDDGHIASPEVVREMLHSLMRNGAELDIEHDGKVLSKAQAYIAEAFTIQKGDARFAGWANYDGTSAGDLTGAAAVEIKIDDPALRASRLAGVWDGVSLFGVGEGVPEQLTKSDPQETPTPMTPEQLKALQDSFSAGLASLQTALVKSVADLVKPAEPKVEPKAEPKADALPTFEGDPSNPTDLETFEKAVRAYEFRKAVAAGTMTATQIAELRKSLSEGEPSDEDVGIEDGDTPLVKSAKLALFKAKRASNAPAPGKPSPELSKIEAEIALGLELAKAANGDAKAQPFHWNVH